MEVPLRSHTKRTYVIANFLKWKKARKAAILATIWLVITGYLLDDRYIQLFVAGSLYTILLSYIAFYLKSRSFMVKSFEKLQSTQIIPLLTLKDETFTLSTPSGTYIMPWSTTHGLIKNKDVWLFFSGTIMFFFPAADLNDEHKQFIESRIKPVVKK